MSLKMFLSSSCHRRLRMGKRKTLYGGDQYAGRDLRSKGNMEIENQSVPLGNSETRRL
jgi:hypothetical protein